MLCYVMLCDDAYDFVWLRKASLVHYSFYGITLIELYTTYVLLFAYTTRGSVMWPYQRQEAAREIIVSNCEGIASKDDFL